MDITRQKLTFFCCYLISGMMGLVLSRHLELPYEAHLLLMVLGGTAGTVLWSKIQTIAEKRTHFYAVEARRSQELGTKPGKTAHKESNVVRLSDFK